MNKTHELKTWPEYYSALRDLTKNFEVRLNDRDFKVGDTLILKEYNNITNSYTGNKVVRTITYILHGGNFGIESGYCVIGLQ